MYALCDTLCVALCCRSCVAGIHRSYVVIYSYVAWIVRVGFDALCNRSSGACYHACYVVSMCYVISMLHDLSDLISLTLTVTQLDTLTQAYRHIALIYPHYPCISCFYHCTPYNISSIVAGVYPCEPYVDY